MPSQKILGFLVVVAGLVTSIIIVLGGDTSSNAISSVNNLVAGDKISIPENPDWQTEIAKFSNAELTMDESGAETVTDNVSRSLMSNYVSLKGNGDLSDASKQDLVSNTTDYIATLGQKKIDVVSLNIVEDRGKISIIEYGSRLGDIFKYNKPKNPENEMEVFKNLLSEDIPKNEDVEKLEDIIATYNKIYAELLKIPVPKKFEKAHVDTVYGLQGMILGLKDMVLGNNDSIKAVNGMDTYQKNAELMISALTASQRYIINSGVSYEQGGGGYYLLHGI